MWTCSPAHPGSAFRALQMSEHGQPPTDSAAFRGHGSPVVTIPQYPLDLHKLSCDWGSCVYEDERRFGWLAEVITYKTRSSFDHIYNSLFHRGRQTYLGALGHFKEGTQNPKGHCMVIPSVTSLPVGTRGRWSSPYWELPRHREGSMCMCIPFF